MYYRYTSKWVESFRKHPEMVKVETLQYIKGLHNLLNAHFDLKNQEGFAKTLQIFKELEQLDVVQHNDNNRIQAFGKAPLTWDVSAAPKAKMLVRATSASGLPHEASIQSIIRYPFGVISMFPG